MIYTEEIDENNIKLSVFNRNLYINLTRLSVGLQFFRELSETSRKHVSPLADRMASYFVNKAVTPFENIYHPSNSTQT